MQPMLGQRDYRRIAVLLCVCFGGCIGASVTFNAQLEDVNVNFSSGLPEPGTIPTVTCATNVECDVFETAELTFTCVDNQCNPDVIVVAQTLSDVDFAALSAATLSVLDTVELRRVVYDYTQNTLPLDVGPIEIFWAPAGAATLEVDGMVRPDAYRLGTFPAIAANTTPEGEMVLDEVGNDALSDYLRDSALTVRFFVRSSFDLEPGDTIPASAAVEATFTLTIKATGELL
jgi:hypothetical protein